MAENTQQAQTVNQAVQQQAGEQKPQQTYSVANPVTGVVGQPVQFNYSNVPQGYVPIGYRFGIPVFYNPSAGGPMPDLQNVILLSGNRVGNNPSPSDYAEARSIAQAYAQDARAVSQVESIASSPSQTYRLPTAQQPVTYPTGNTGGFSTVLNDKGQVDIQRGTIEAYGTSTYKSASGVMAEARDASFLQSPLNPYRVVQGTDSMRYSPYVPEVREQFIQTKFLQEQAKYFGKSPDQINAEFQAEQQRQQFAQNRLDYQNEFLQSSLSDKFLKTGSVALGPAGVKIASALPNVFLGGEQPLEIASREYGIMRAQQIQAGTQGDVLKSSQYALDNMLSQGATVRIGAESAFWGYAGGRAVAFIGEWGAASPAAGTLAAYGQTLGKLPFAAEIGGVASNPTAQKAVLGGIMAGLPVYTYYDVKGQYAKAASEGYQTPSASQVETEARGAALGTLAGEVVGFKAFEAGLKAGQPALQIVKATDASGRESFRLVSADQDIYRITAVQSAEKQVSGNVLTGETQTSQSIISLSRTSFERPTFVEGTAEARLTQALERAEQTPQGLAITRTFRTGTGQGVFTPTGQIGKQMAIDAGQVADLETGEMIPSMRVVTKGQGQLAGIPSDLDFRFNVANNAQLEKGTIFARAGETGGTVLERPASGSMIGNYKLAQRVEFPLSDDLQTFYGLKPATPSNPLVPTQAGTLGQGVFYTGRTEGVLQIPKSLIEKGIVNVQAVNPAAENLARQAGLSPAFASMVGARQAIRQQLATEEKQRVFSDEESTFYIPRPRQASSVPYESIPAEKRQGSGLQVSTRITAQEPKATVTTGFGLPSGFSFPSLPNTSGKLSPSLPSQGSGSSTNNVNTPADLNINPFNPKNGNVEIGVNPSDDYGQKGNFTNPFKNIGDTIFKPSDIGKIINIIPPVPPVRADNRSGGGFLGIALFGKTPKRGSRSKAFSFEYFADYFSKTYTELRTGKPARSPSASTAEKYFRQTGGLFVPTFEMLKGSKKKRRG